MGTPPGIVHAAALAAEGKGKCERLSFIKTNGHGGVEYYKALLPGYCLGEPAQCGGRDVHTAKKETRALNMVGVHPPPDALNGQYGTPCLYVHYRRKMVCVTQARARTRPASRNSPGNKEQNEERHNASAQRCCISIHNMNGQLLHVPATPSQSQPWHRAAAIQVVGG